MNKKSNNMNMNEFLKNLTIIVQGPFLKNMTEKSLYSLISLFPNNLIIFSTWKTHDSSIFNDFSKRIKVIFNTDPGSDSEILKGDFYSLKSNTHRMLLSTLKGLDNVSSKWVLKLRSDIEVHNIDFINEYLLSNPEDSDVTKNKIMVLRIVNPILKSNNGTEFHNRFYIDDWLNLGLTCDIKNIYTKSVTTLKNIPLYSNNEIFIKNNHLFAEKILWNSIFKDLNYLNNKSNFKMFVKNNLMLINNSDNRYFKVQKYKDHFKSTRRIYRDISFYRSFEINKHEKDLISVVKTLFLNSIRLINFMLKNLIHIILILTGAKKNAN